jgi:hypothetical protein
MLFNYKKVKIMKKTISTLLVAITFGLILSGSAIAGEDVDDFTLSFQNNVATDSAIPLYINKASYTTGELSRDSILAMCYDSTN